MPHSPRTPTRRRLSSGIDFSIASASPQSHWTSPQYENYNFPKPSQSHRTSLYSIPSPSTSQPPSSHDRRGSFGVVSGFGGVAIQGDGLGSLADELAEAWDDDGQGEAEDGGIGALGNGIGAIHHGQLDLSERLRDSPFTDTTPDFMTSPSRGHLFNSSSSLTKRRYRPKHHRKFSSYGESEYGEGSDHEEDIDTPLLARMAAIESLARHGVEIEGCEPDTIVQRVANSLKDLESQSGLENGATR